MPNGVQAAARQVMVTGAAGASDNGSAVQARAEKAAASAQGTGPSLRRPPWPLPLGASRAEQRRAPVAFSAHTTALPVAPKEAGVPERAESASAAFVRTTRWVPACAASMP